ncbi:membrane-bound O-acyltransferase family MBOAT [Leptospira fainei serovar Hurstbridge str. BUT 6]|uniref:Membrane-bound O-acyltransferase family MBOAT n=1 Tax=Leptospira fainei serovar Hurstbridge str. BUT 6 TaxID=1193011 RepID=S3V670_9LEPT|nr:MBOAT family O-acyltransferase [Leptospira fainei]EPG76154.1 membrane-bound O-acyltransferase family MBOAT [Leptospira fainei serovar Hurstbridge str. BUT 6]
MLFNSVQYLIFAPVVIAVYFLLPARFQKWWLLLTSLYFYAVFRVPFVALLIYSIVLTYYCVVWMDKAVTKSGKLFFLNLVVWGNLLLLYFFKYLDFSFIAWNTILGLQPCESCYAYPSGVLLPMGISFFTLQAIAYAVDVYRGHVGRAKNLFQFGLFLSFFPQLVAGPIIRAQDMLHQFLEEYRFRNENLLPGIRQIAWGLFKKTFVADPIALIIDPVYGNPSVFGWEALSISAVLFSFQVYCDFSGYSDVAIGTGRIMGYHIPANFREPFLSQSITELWRRWHISFSSWLREYVYIPLGGNKKGIPRMYLNLFLTTFVSGIWHGADWNFIIWGAIHAFLMVIERFILSFNRISQAWEKVPQIIKIAYTFFFFAVSMFFFRAKAAPGYEGSIDVAWTMTVRAFTAAKGLPLDVPLPLFVAVIALMAGDYIVDRKIPILEKLTDKPIWVYSISAVLLSICFILYSVTVSQPFLYFQF